MPKLKRKRIRTIRKPVKVWSSNRWKGKVNNSEEPRFCHYLHFLLCVVHYDGTPCCFYCSFLTKDGFGVSPAVVSNHEELCGNYDEVLCVLELLSNSKAFIEYLCSCRYYIYSTNTSKKSYFTLVLSSFIRELNTASKYILSSFDSSRFLSYCLKWIPEFKTGVISPNEFLQLYMNRIDGELKDINETRFKIWCGKSFVNVMEDESTLQNKESNKCLINLFIILVVSLLLNPFQSLLAFVDGDNPMKRTELFMINLHTQAVFSCFISALSNSPVNISLSTPVLAIEASLRQNHNNVMKYARSLLLKCNSTKDDFAIPPFITLPCHYVDSETAHVYSLINIVSRCDAKSLVIFKRLFPARKYGERSRKIYDAHASGRWIRIDGETVSDVNWKEVSLVKPVILHYEIIERLCVY